jgi:hypothetical protein
MASTQHVSYTAISPTRSANIWRGKQIRVAIRLQAMPHGNFVSSGEWRCVPDSEVPPSEENCALCPILNAWLNVTISP